MIFFFGARAQDDDAKDKYNLFKRSRVNCKHLAECNH